MKMISEVMKTNTILTTLDLSGEDLKEQRMLLSRERIERMRMNRQYHRRNRIDTDK